MRKILLPREMLDGCSTADLREFLAELDRYARGELSVPESAAAGTALHSPCDSTPEAEARSRPGRDPMRRGRSHENGAATLAPGRSPILPILLVPESVYQSLVATEHPPAPAEGLSLGLSDELAARTQATHCSMQIALDGLRDQLIGDLGVRIPRIGVTTLNDLSGLRYSVEFRRRRVAQRSLPASLSGSWDFELTRNAVLDSLGEVIRCAASELIGRQEIAELMRYVNEKAPEAYRDASEVDRGAVVAVVREFLQCKIPIRDPVGLLEAIADHKKLAGRPNELIDRVRVSMARQLVGPLCASPDELTVMKLSAAFERTLGDAFHPGSMRRLAPSTCQALVASVTEACDRFAAKDLRPVVVAARQIRRDLYNLLRRFLPQLHMLSPEEIPAETRVLYLGEIHESGIRPLFAARSGARKGRDPATNVIRGAFGEPRDDAAE